MPATTAVPLSGCSRVVRTRTAVVLPAPLGPSRPEDRALRHVEVDAVQCPDVAEGLDQTFGVDGAWHMCAPVRRLTSWVTCLGLYDPADVRTLGPAELRGRLTRTRYTRAYHDAIYRVYQWTDPTAAVPSGRRVLTAVRPQAMTV